jgi:DNA-directed RNA polymerase
MQSALLKPEGPHLEDRWDDQVRLEMEMLERGRELMSIRIEKARTKKDMTRLRPVRSLITEFLPPVIESLEGWMSSVASSKGGPKPIAHKYLTQLPTGTSSLLALRTVFRCISIEKREIIPLAYEIGSWVENEARMLAWEDEDPEGWDGLRKFYQQRGANAAHLRRATSAVFNKHIRQRIGWGEWGQEARRRVGLQLLDNVIQGTRRFHIASDMSLAKARSSKRDPRAWPLVLQPDQGMMDWLAGALDDEMLHMPVFMPTLIKPKGWDGPRDGGYWTPFVSTPFLIRFKASHETQRQRAIDEYDALDMPEVYSAINHVQDTSWRINRGVFETVRHMWDKDLALGGLPRKEELPVPPRPENWEEDPEGYKRWRGKAGDINTANAKAVSKMLGVDRTIGQTGQARRFLDCEEFFFPQMLDFRGRMYPIPSDLSPQGNDLHRGILEFAEGKPVGEDGGSWLGVQVANTHGVDKVSLQERVDWAFERRDLWRAIAEDPLEYRQWVEADDPFQALAAIKDLDGYIREGSSYVSHAPIRVDGTCNGIQHLSALIRDEEGGASVNLLESDSPRDIYQEVADTLTEVLEVEHKDGNELASAWLDAFGGHAPRSVTKRPVMILPYGGTRMAYMQYTHEWLDEFDPVGLSISREIRGKAVGFLASRMWGAVSARLQKAQEVMKWLQDCSKVASASGLPLYWTTPAGFVVRHFYGEITSRQVKVKLDGHRVDLRVNDVQPTLDAKAQATGIAPNFIHSLDASAMMSCINLCKAEGINSLTTIHDSYGTHASDMWKLYSCIREGFIETYRGDPLDDFLAGCHRIAPNASAWPQMPKRGTLNIEAVRFSDYFFS